MFINELVLEPDTRNYLLSSKRVLEKETPIIMDIGANKGDFTTLALSIYPYAMIHCFEPVPEIYNHLSEKFKDNSQIKVYNFGFFNENKTETDFYYLKNNAQDPVASGMSSLYYRETVFPKFENEKINVKVIKLDEMLDKISKVNYIKIDTEGAEVAVLEGGRKFIQQRTPEFIQWEYGGCFIDSNTTGKQAVEILNSLGYEIVNQYFVHVTPDNFLENYLCYNLLGVRKDIFSRGRE